MLTDAELAHYHDEGYFSPVPVLSSAEVADYRGRLEAFEATQGGHLKAEQRNKCHLLFRWIDELMRDPRVLDPIAQILGPDLLCWNTIFWIKEPRAESFVSWHQDITYWGLAGGEVVSAWLALSPASEAAGCMRVLPKSHLEPAMAHQDRYAATNMLTRGQEIDGIDEEATVSMPLEPGQMSLHSVRLAHASGPNETADRRIGLSMHFMPTLAYQSAADWDSAALVRGSDSYGHFEHTPPVTGDFAPDAVAFHAKAGEAVRKILYRDAERDTQKL
ncbi:MAG: phytanoyl-CoA dioxygenase family protein [Pseudomonadota bacterium]